MKNIVAVIAILLFGTIFPEINKLYAENKILKVRVEHFPNYSFKDKNGDWTGVEVELAQALVTTAGFTPEYFQQPWARGVESIRQGDLDLIVGFGITEERKEFALWVGPIYTVVVSLVVKEGTAEMLPITSLDDMIKVSRDQDKKFGYAKDTFWSKEFNDRLINDPEFAGCFETVIRSELNRRKTIEGTILGFFGERSPHEYQIKNDVGYKGLMVHPFILDSRPTFIGISKKGVNAPTLYSLYEAYEKLTLDGTLKQIRAKWNY